MGVGKSIYLLISNIFNWFGFGHFKVDLIKFLREQSNGMKQNLLDTFGPNISTFFLKFLSQIMKYSAVIYFFQKEFLNMFCDISSVS